MALDGNILDSFWVSLGFRTDPKGIEQFQQASEKLRGFVLKLGAALSVPALGLFVEEVAKGMGELQHFADLNKLGALQVAALNRVAEENLIPMDSMESSIQSLNVKLGEAATGLGRGAMIFKKLGLQAKDSRGHVKSFDTILGDVSAKMQKLNNRSESLAIARKLGLDPKLVPLLEKGKASFDALVASAYGANPLSADEYERAEEITKQFRVARLNVQILYREIGVKLFPVVQKVLQKFLDWYKTLSTDKNNAFNRSLKVMAEVAESIWRDFAHVTQALEPFIRWVSNNAPVWLMKSALYALAAALAAVGVASALSMAGGGLRLLVSIGPAIASSVAIGITALRSLGIVAAVASAPIALWVAAIASLAGIAYVIYDRWSTLMRWWTDAWGVLGDEIKSVVSLIPAPLRLAGSFAGDALASPWNVPGAAASLWGAPSSYSRATTVIHNTTVPSITVVSPDPSKAGEAVRNELHPHRNRTLIRNAQSGTAL